MSVLNNESKYGQIPKIEIPRSRFPMNHGHKTSFNVGEIIPIDCMEVIPGSTIDFDISHVVRMQTMLDPIMDNLYLDEYSFFVPMRLVWNHTKEFFGENTTAPWKQTTTYQIPQITAPSGGWNVGTLADYFGIPTGVGNLSVNALPFRAYALTMNEWFRYTPVTTPCNVPVDDTTQSGSNGSSYVTDVVNGGTPFIAKKLTSSPFENALPSPQCGPDVTVPLGQYASVVTTGDTIPFSKFPKFEDSGNKYSYPVLYKLSNDAGITSNSLLSTNTNGQSNISLSTTENYASITPRNLYADLENATASSINQLRTAFAIQRYYEKLSRAGNRYREQLQTLYGVTPQDSRVQIPEFLGHSRSIININQVVQTSGTVSTTEENGTETTPQGTLTAYSQTNGKTKRITKSFCEHGYLITLAIVRYDHSYPDGLEPMWTRKDHLDVYQPTFANLGEQKIRNDSLFAQGTSADSEAFGYQEAWYDYRWKPSRVSGEMRPKATNTLASWHLADNYASLPTLSDTWVREDKTNLDRCLAVTSSVSNQFFGDFYVNMKVTAPMPVYSVPGLIDHF